MEWSYDNTVATDVGIHGPAEIAPAAPVATAIEAPSTGLEPHHLAEIAASPELQTHVAGLMGKGYSDEELVHHTKNAIEESKQRQLESNNLGSQMATGASLGGDLDRASLEHESGHSTVTEADQKAAASRGAALAASMAGKSDAEILQAVAQLSLPPQEQAAAQAAAQQQIDASKFNIFASHGQSTDQGNALTLGSVLGFGETKTQENAGEALVGASVGTAILKSQAAPTAAHEQAANEVTADRMQHVDLGDTGQALADAGIAGGFKPSQVPDVRQNRGISQSAGRA